MAMLKMNNNPYLTYPVKIIRKKKEIEGVKLFRFSSPKGFSFGPGQFIQLSIPGFGEAPFAPCSDPFEKDFFELCVRKAGILTDKLHRLKVGDIVGVRGPYGKGWPVAATKTSAQGGCASGAKNTNILLVAGGLGMIPLRPLILAKEELFGKDSKVQLFCGAKSPDNFLFQDEYKKWGRFIDIHLTVDNLCVDWKNCVGLITVLFDKVKIIENARVFACGPPIMYKFVLAKLKEKGFKSQDIFLSLERRMHCGIAVCQHCAVGVKYACKDGPVFKSDDVGIF